MSSDYIKIIFTTLITLVLSTSAFWFTEAKHYVTREDVQTLINNHNKLLISQIQDYNQDNQDTFAIQQKIIESIQEIQNQLAIITERLEYIQNENNQ